MNLGLLLNCGGFHFVVVDGFRIAANVVESCAIKLAAEAEPVAVRKVTAMREIETENRVAGLEDCRECRCVCLGAGMRLHVDVVAAKDLFGAIAGQVLDDVGVLASAIIAATGIALRVFVGKYRSRRPPELPRRQSSRSRSSPAPHAGGGSRVQERRLRRGRPGRGSATYGQSYENSKTFFLRIFPLLGDSAVIIPEEQRLLWV